MCKQKQKKEILGSTLLLCNGTYYASVRTLIRIQIFDAYQKRQKKQCDKWCGFHLEHIELCMCAKES